jgi:Mn2+/Fe2+ NRAMP family transporter
MPEAATTNPSAAVSNLTAEDLSRSKDRLRVLDARHKGRGPMLLWLLTGPGVLAMLGENDGPSMLSYAATGATYGIGFFLPFIAVTFLAAYVVQEMAMRLGAVTHRGYGELIFQRFGPFWGWLSAGDLVVTNLITLVTEIIAIRVGMAYFGISPVLSVAFSVLLVALSTSGGRYWRWERFTMGLVLFNLLFVVVAVLAHPSPAAIADAMATWTPLPHGTVQALLLIVASNIGATVTPWMLFFQQSASVDKGLTPRDIGQGRLDTLIGTVLAALAGCAAVVAASVLFTHHVDTSALQGGTGYAEALRPLIGAPGAALFALGLIEAGAVAMLTISASTAYAVGEVIGGAGHSFNRSIRAAPAFYAANLGMALAAGAIVLIPGVPLLAIGTRANSWTTNTLGILITALVTLAGAGYAVVAFFNSFGSGG